MQHQQEISMITRGAPPSYGEVMEQSTAPKSSQVTPFPTTSDPNAYSQYPQMTSHPEPMLGFATQNNYPTYLGSQPPYNPAYIPTVPPQQDQSIQYIVHADSIISAPERKSKKHSCLKKFIIFVICVILLSYLLKVLIYHLYINGD